MRSLDVLIPHFNDPEGLRESIASIQEQTHRGPLRIVVVDDGSTESARAAARSAVEESGLSFTFEVNDGNRGRPYTRNRLRDLVDAEYVAWLDAGDFWYPKKLEEQFSRLQELEARNLDTSRVWLTCDYDWKWTGRPRRCIEQRVEGDQTRSLLIGQHLRAYLWTLLCPARSLRMLGAFDERLPRLQDLDYFLRFVAAGGRFAKPTHIEPYPLCVYNKSDIGRNSSEIRKCNERIYEKHAPLFHRYGRDFVRRRRAYADLHSARFARNNREFGSAAYFVGRALLMSPHETYRHIMGMKAE